MGKEKIRRGERMKYGDCKGCECLRKNARQFYRCWVVGKNISVLDKCPKLLQEAAGIEAAAAKKNVEEFIATRENNNEKPMEVSHGIFDGIKKIMGG